MSLWRKLMGQDEDVMLDHTPISPAARRLKKAEAKRRAALQTAAQRHGKPFKCASKGMMREHYVTPGLVAIVDAPDSGQSTVTKLRAAGGKR